MPGIRDGMTVESAVRLAMNELTARRVQYSQWWDYYDGRQKKFLKIRDGEPDYNVTVNLCARAVNQSVNFMLGKMPSFDLPSESNEIGKALLNGWAQAIDLEDFLNDLLTSAAVTGHAFVKLLPDDTVGVRLVALDSSLVSVWWDETDKAHVLGYMVTWSTINEKGKVVVFREDHWRAGEQWEIITYSGDGLTWIETGRNAWPYPFPQICDWKNMPNSRGYYGKSDIEQVIGLNDAYNFRQSNTNKILYIHAHPRTVGFGIRKQDIQTTSIDGFWAIPDANARLENLEMQSDLESSRLQAQEIKADFFSDSGTVDLATVKDKVGQLTNFGLKLLFTEALAKNAKKRLLAGRGLSEMLRRVGVLLDQDWNGVKVVWADPLPENTAEQVANAKEVIAMGVSSRQTEAERLGYDWEREKARRAKEEQNDQVQAGISLAAALTRFDQGNQA